jgi:uncharacterized protein (TIGR02001 family)
LDAAIGRTFGYPVIGDYTDWTVGLSRDFAGVNLGLHYYGTDISVNVNGQNFDITASDTIVLSAKYTF